MTVKTAVTDEQIKAAIQAMAKMYAASKDIQNIMAQLGWNDLEEEVEERALEAIGADEFTRNFWAMLDAVACPGHDIMTCKELAKYLDNELERRVLAQQVGFKP